MDAPSFLDWNHADQIFSGIAEDWWQITTTLWVAPLLTGLSKQMPLKSLFSNTIISNVGRRCVAWSLSHYTHSRQQRTPSTECKCLLRYGALAECLVGKQRQMKRARIPFLVNEVTRWNPEGTGARTDDCVMAQWFMEHNLKSCTFLPRKGLKQWRPTWISGQDSEYASSGRFFK